MFQMILVIIIAVVFVAMIFLLFAGKKSSKKTTKGVNKDSNKSKPEKNAKKAEPVKEESKKEESLKIEEKPEDSPKEEKKEEPKEEKKEPVIKEKPAPSESVMISAKEIILEVGKKYIVGKDFKAGVYKLETLNEEKTADINLYGLDVPYNNGEKLVLANDDKLIAKSPKKIKKKI